MLDIHNRVHNLRLSTKNNFDAIPMVADTILEQSWLLCFDEFQVLKKNYFLNITLLIVGPSQILAR